MCYRLEANSRLGYGCMQRQRRRPMRNSKTYSGQRTKVLQGSEAVSYMANFVSKIMLGLHTHLRHEHFNCSIAVARVHVESTAAPDFAMVTTLEIARLADGRCVVGLATLNIGRIINLGVNLLAVRVDVHYIDAVGGTLWHSKGLCHGSHGNADSDIDEMHIGG